MGHNHVHHRSTKNLKIAFFLNLGFTVFEIIGGIYVNSVSIISDAVHDLGDSLSLGTAWFLEKKSVKKANNSYTFGYARFSLLGALINSVVLIVGSIFVIYSAIDRLIHPEFSDANGMILFACFGILINGYAAWKLSGGKSLNERVVSWHLLEDVLGWVAILVVAVILKFKNVPYLDPALSLFITAYILYGVTKRLKETLHLFLQGVPSQIDMNELELRLLKLTHVESIHHTHVWSLEGKAHVFTAHIRVNDIVDLNHFEQVKKEIKSELSTYHFKHITLEIEWNGNSCSLSD